MLGVVFRDFVFAIPTSLKNSATPKPRFVVISSLEDLRVADDASQFLLCLIHRKIIAYHVVFSQVPALSHPVQCARLLARSLDS